MSSAPKNQRCSTRRDFVRKVAAGAAGVTVAGALGRRTAMPDPTVKAKGEVVYAAAKDALKIDVFAQVLPRRYLAAYARKNNAIAHVEARSRAISDIDYRMKLMDKFPDVLQVLTIASPPQDIYVTPNQAAELAALANDELAELLAKYPHKFAAAVACLPTNNMDAALQEADRTITQLGFKGVQICTRVAGLSLDQPQFKPLWRKMTGYDLPIWIHPSVYDGLDQEEGILSWAIETSVATHRLVKAGIFNDYPNIKFITHHCAAILPYLEKELKRTTGGPESGTKSLLCTLEEHFRRFYNDTACHGTPDELMRRYDFFGADRMLFGTGDPLSPMNDQMISSVAQMSIPEAERMKIFTRNAASMLRLPLENQRCT